MGEPNIDLRTIYTTLVDERFTKSTPLGTITNQQDFYWVGADAVKVYTVATAQLTDYHRHGKLGEGEYGRYGTPTDLDHTTQTEHLTQDKAFTYVMDHLDMEQTLGYEEALTQSIGRQMGEVVIPTVEKYVLNKMITGAGIKPTAVTLTPENIYDEILKANKELDNAFVPNTDRNLVVTPEVYQILKKSKEVVLETTQGQDMRMTGIISNLDGLNVIKVPSVRVPEKFGFMVAYKHSTIFAQHLTSVKDHINPPGINGVLVEGRIVYDAFVLNNKKKGIYYQEIV